LARYIGSLFWFVGPSFYKIQVLKSHPQLFCCPFVGPENYGKYHVLLVLSDEQMNLETGIFSINNEQMSNLLGEKHYPENRNV